MSGSGVSGVSVSEDSISYAIESDQKPSDPQVVLVGAFNQSGQLVGFTLETVDLSNGSGSGTVSIHTDDDYTYRIFIASENGYVPLCAGWRSDAA